MQQQWIDELIEQLNRFDHRPSILKYENPKNRSIATRALERTIQYTTAQQFHTQTDSRSRHKRQYINGIISNNIDLWIASDTGDTDAVRNLLRQKHINVNFVFGGQTALIIASENGYTDIVRLLLEKKANPDFRDIINGSTALIYAVKNKHIEIVRLLLKYGANRAFKNSEDMSAFDYGLRNEDLDILLLLEPIVAMQFRNQKHQHRRIR